MKTQYDLIVIGGGFTGCAAALAAARHGLSVLLVDKSGSLGGAATNCLVNPFMPYKTTIGKDENGNSQELALSQGIFGEIVEKLEAMGAKNPTDGTFDDVTLRILLDRMMTEAGVQVLFHSTLCGIAKAGNKIISASFATKADVLTFSAGTFIDCTGDADFAAMSGCQTRLGRDPDNLCQPMTLCFRVGNVNLRGQNIWGELRQRMNALYQKLQKEGKIRNPRENVLMFTLMYPNTLHFNSTRVVKLNPTDPFDLTKAEMEAREQMLELFHFAKENFEEFKDSSIVACAADIGVRESRMLVGRYVVTAEEFKDCTRFPDAIAAGNYDIDIHNPEGAGTSHYFFGPGQYYTIPYRSLQPKEFDNVLVAGRCISSTHEAQASYRIMPIVCTLGEAAGTAAAVAKQTGSNVGNVDVAKVQDALRKAGAFIGL